MDKQQPMSKIKHGRYTREGFSPHIVYNKISLFQTPMGFDKCPNLCGNPSFQARFVLLNIYYKVSLIQVYSHFRVRLLLSSLHWDILKYLYVSAVEGFRLRDSAVNT